MLEFVYLLLCVLFTGGGFLSLGLKEDACISSCIEKESQALLDVRANLSDFNHLLDDWGSSEELDYCKWVGVSCNNHTGHVIELDLGHVVEARKLNYSGYSFAGTISPSLKMLNQLQHLNLDYVDFQSSPLPDFLASMSNLRRLHISGTNLTGPIPHQLANLSNLFHLDLSGNSLTGSIPFSFGHFTSLTYLDLSNNQLGGVIPKSFGNSSSLAHLDLSQNLLNGSFPNFSRCSSLMNMSLAHNSLNGRMPDFTQCTFLKRLDISNNLLDGDISNSVSHLLNLEYLDVGNNSLKGSMPEFVKCAFLQTLDLSDNLLNGYLSNSVGQLSNLKFLDVGRNFLNGSIPNFIECPYLWFLDMSSNDLYGNVPKILGRLSNLEYLDLSSNSLTDIISDIHFLNLTQLYYLDLSFNNLALEFSFNWRFHSQLTTIKLQSCKVGPRFPEWIKNQESFTHLDISSTGISDHIPGWFWELSRALTFMNLSSNNLRGRLPDMSNLSYFFDGHSEMDLSDNHLEGSVTIYYSLLTLNLSRNKFSGTLSFLCDSVGSLNILDLSNNLFSGSLPDCLLKFQPRLVVLNLSNNNLSGNIPSSLGFLSYLESLTLRTNTFVGEIPMSLSMCTRLKFVDFRENKLSGVIPEWIGEKLSELNVLVLGSNRFTGRLPSQICWLNNLQVLDLSDNGLSGNIPRCFNNFTAMVSRNFDNSTIMARRRFGDDMTGHSKYSYVRYIHLVPCVSPARHHLSCPHPYQVAYYFDNTRVTWKGTKRSFGRTGLQLLKNIDLSNNNLSGKVPYEITGLFELVSLNLSNNKLHGDVPKDMGHLKSLESLDLSKNELSGRIPGSLSMLNFLSVLDLSFNNLSGRIPTGSQLQLFNYTSYIGNTQLCGPPLTPRCGFVPVVGKKDDEEDEEDEDDFGKSYYLGMAVGFVSGFWGICGVLFFNRRCRYFFFVLLIHMKDWIYVTVAVHLGKLERKFRS